MPNQAYDIRTGHYRILNEDDASQQSSTQQNTQQNPDQQAQQQNNNTDQTKEQSASKLEQDAIYQKLIAQKAELQKSFELKHLPIKQQRTKISAELSAKGIDPELSTKIINLDTIIQKDKFDLLQKINNLDKQIIARRNEMKVESFNALGIPGKYHKLLLEGDIESKKLCLNELFDTYEQFLAVFENSNMLYATDNDGMYVIIESYDDIQEARKILYGCGLHECVVDAELLPLIEKQEPGWFI